MYKAFGIVNSSSRNIRVEGLDGERAAEDFGFKPGVVVVAALGDGKVVKGVVAVGDRKLATRVAAGADLEILEAVEGTTVESVRNFVSMG